MLEDVVKINPGSKLPDHFHYVDLESVKGTELISSRIEYNDTAPSRAKRLARPGDIFFQLVRPYQKNNYLFNLTEKNYVFSTGYAQLRPLINSEYLINYLTTDNFTSKVLNRSTGTSYPAINSSDLVKIKVLIPNDELESLKIGEVLELMNKVITLHQRKLEQLEKLKQALLQQLFPQKDENVPRLRFANFAGDWEQRKLGDSLKVLDGDRGINYPHESDFFQSGDTLFLNTGNVTKNGFNFNTVKYITKEKDELLRAGRLEENDFVLTSRGTLGNIGFYDHKIYKDYPKVRINSAMLILRNVDKQLSYSYLHSVLKGKLISDFMKKNQVGSAQPHITKTEFLKLNLSIPENIKEQNKIGSIFNNFDKNITLHHHKFNQLKLLKKELLQQMFI